MYRPLIKFEIKVNPNTQWGTGRVNPTPKGASVCDGPPLSRKLFVCMDFCQAQFQLASSVLVELRLVL